MPLRRRGHALDVHSRIHNIRFSPFKKKGMPLSAWIVPACEAQTLVGGRGLALTTLVVFELRAVFLMPLAWHRLAVCLLHYGF